MKKTIATPVGLDIPYVFTSTLPPRAKDETIADFNARKSTFNNAKALIEQKEADRLEELTKYGDHALTTEEITAREEEEAQAAVDKIKYDQLTSRRQALADKWKEPFDLIDDILNRGMDVVKTERDAIKASNPV